MPRAAVTKQTNSFINGIVTDNNEFAAPDNAALDMLNVDINQKGECNRRKGLKEVSGAAESNLTTVDAESAVTQCVRWSGAGTDRATNLVACQEGYTLTVYDDTSAGTFPGPIASADIWTASGLAAGYADEIEAAVWDMVPGDDGALYIMTGNCKPVRVTYNSGTATLTAAKYELYIRETEYVDDGGFAVDYRPSSAEVLAASPTGTAGEVIYNLMMNGWTYLQASNYYLTVNSVYPSRAEQPFRAKGVSGAPDNAYLFQLTPGSGAAPAGRIIQPLYLTDRNSICSNAIAERTIPTYTGPQCCAFYANRVFYGGFTVVNDDNPGLDATIFYSQIITSKQNGNQHYAHEACYSVNDPSHEYENAILATDGGSLTLPGVGRVKRMYPLGNALILFSTNGIWSLAGDNGDVFRPDNFSISKISKSIPIAYKSILEVGASLVFWLDQGIFSLEDSPTARGSYVLNELTANRYKQGFQELIAGTTYIDNVQGFYDDKNQYLQWLYAPDSAVDTQYGFTSILRLNLKTGAITKYEIDAGIVLPPLRIGAMTLFNKAGSENEVHYLIRKIGSPTTTIYTRFHTFTSEDFIDFSGQGSYESETVPYITLWPEHVGAPHLSKEVLYLHTFMRRTEQNWTAAGTFDYPSGGTITAYWDWAENEASGKKIGPHDCYRMLRLPADPGSGYPVALDYYPSLIINKIKIRGQGRAVQIRFDGVSEKDFQLLGWSMPLHVETA